MVSRPDRMQPVRTQRRRNRPGAARPSGVTLIELMIVVAIIAILAAIAYPSYQEQIRKTRRAEAQAALLELAQFLERNRTHTGRYDIDGAGNPVTLPYTEIPRERTAKYYTLTLETLTPSAFTLKATPQGPQAGDTKCASLSLAHTGAKTATGTNAANCW